MFFDTIDMVITHAAEVAFDPSQYMQLEKWHFHGQVDVQTAIPHLVARRS